MLGHSSIVLTADTYTSVLPEVARTAAEKVAALILGPDAWSREPSARARPGRAGESRRHNRRGRAAAWRHPARQIARRPAAAE